ncbi:MAG: PrsW family glutamic-type intramembrane protease [Patescibacteria group bacterium]
MTSDPKILGLAFLGGIIPSLLWLWFWLKEDKKNPEPKGLLAIVFMVGMIAVIFVLPIQKFIQGNIDSHEWQLILWASAEEIIKYLAVLVVLYKTSYIDESIDWPIYLITAALGFAALENGLFLLKPLSMGQNTVSLLTGELRFLGSTLLHTVSSGILGVALGISLQMKGFKRKSYLVIGLLFAIALHSVFNFFIIRNSGNDFLKVFGFLWVVTIIVMLLFEKVRRMN